MATDRKYSGGQGTTGLFVSLYLILIAFFMVMTALSKQVPAKAGPAITSISDTFDKSNRDSGEIQRTLTVEQAAIRDEFTTELKGLFLAELSIEGRAATTGGNVYEISFSADEIFTPGSVDLKEGRQRLLDKIGAIISSPPVRQRRDVAIFFEMKSDDLAPTLGRLPLASRRAEGLAIAMRAKGLPAGSFSTGLVAGAGNKIIAVFRSVSVEGATLRQPEQQGGGS